MYVLRSKLKAIFKPQMVLIFFYPVENICSYTNTE